jgi:hypothetical protein
MECAGYSPRFVWKNYTLADGLVLDEASVSKHNALGNPTPREMVGSDLPAPPSQLDNPLETQNEQLYSYPPPAILESHDMTSTDITYSCSTPAIENYDIDSYLWQITQPNEFSASSPSTASGPPLRRQNSFYSLPDASQDERPMDLTPTNTRPSDAELSLPAAQRSTVNSSRDRQATNDLDLATTGSQDMSTDLLSSIPKSLHFASVVLLDPSDRVLFEYCKLRLLQTSSRI